MANREDSDIDDDFSELYKEYTGPPVLNSTRVQNVAKGNKRSHAGSEEDEEPRDPNAVPTDFTSREAKVWEAKSKATERNWKKRKEEEMICKICGESGHFTQGCPSTLGASRKSQDFFERVPAREPHVKALFSDKVVSKIEKDIGCKIKIEEKFIIVSGRDRLILAKGVDAVHKVKEEGDKKSGSTSHATRSKSPETRSPVGNRFARSDSQRSFQSSQTATHFLQRFSKQEKVVEDIAREDLKMLSRGSPQAYGNDGARRHSSQSKSPARPGAYTQPKSPTRPAAYTQSKSPARPAAYTQSKSPARPAAYTQSKSPARPAAYTQSKSPARPAAYTQSKSPTRPATYTGESYNSYDGHSHIKGEYRTDGWETDKRRPDMQSGHKLEYPVIQQTLEELELEYERDAITLGRIRDKEEDEENYRHREAVRERRENFMKRLTVLRGLHAKQWEEFLQIDAQRMQERARQQLSTSKYGGYRQPGYSDYDGSAGNPHYAGGNIPLESRVRYQNSMENYPNSRSHETYGDFQRQRHDEFRKAYNRF